MDNWQCKLSSLVKSHIIDDYNVYVLLCVTYYGYCKLQLAGSSDGVSITCIGMC